MSRTNQKLKAPADLENLSSKASSVLVNAHKRANSGAGNGSLNDFITENKMY